MRSVQEHYSITYRMKKTPDNRLQLNRGDSMKQLTIALGTGRLANEALFYLKKIGLVSESMETVGRSLFFEEISKQLRIIFVRNRDVMAVLQSAGSDIGIVGLDIVLENYKKARDLTYPLRLNFAKCRLALACPLTSRLATILKKRQYDLLPIPLKVATKYPNLSLDFFAEKGITVEIIKLNGSIEIAPTIGLADCIVDLVSTGKTLLDNQLIEIDTILESQAVVLIRRGSYAWQCKRIREFIETCQNASEAQ